MSKKTERLVDEVKRELRALRAEVEHTGNPKLLKTYRELLSTLD